MRRASSSRILRQAQEVGQLLHGHFQGKFITVFTPEEAQRYRPRIFGVEAELAGVVDIEFITVGNVPVAEKSNGRRRRRRLALRRPAAPSPAPALPDTGQDEIARILSVPPVAAKLAKAKARVEPSAAAFVERVFRMCFSASFSPTEIADGLGRTGRRTVSRCRAACRAMHAEGLLNQVAADTYTVDQNNLNRLKALAEAARRK